LFSEKVQLTHFAVIYTGGLQMRFLTASLALVAVFCLGGIAMPAVALAQGQPAQGKLDVNINTHSSGGGIWWQSPVWIAIGVIALILLVVIVAMISRGGGTTVIKD
jgi:nitric oxide reductase large subunit